MNAASWLESLPAPDRWRELLLARGPRIATWVFALALGVQAALILTDLGGGKTASGTAISTPGPSLAPAGRRIDVVAIANSHLFGTTAGRGNSEQDPANAPQTRVPLVLTGIIAASDPNNGLAIIGETAVATKLYAVGQTLPGNVKLHAIYNDRVLLDRGGRLESLSLPHTSAATAPGPSAASLPTENPVVERMRRLIAEEPGVLSDIMRPQPVFAQGKQRGYRVYPGRNRQAFVRLGLRPGDLVVAINGTPLDDPARGQEIFQTIGSAAEARVTVLRNGRQQDLTLNMAQVAQDAEQLVGSDAGQGNIVAPGAAAPAAQAPPAPEPPPDPQTERENRD